jgi:release factor glutamine methyltransferase
VDNARRHGVDARIRFVRSDLLDALDSGERFDVIVSNPPYVAENARLAPELTWEPSEALFAGSRGLDVIERLLPKVGERLVPGGSAVVEFGSDQEALVRASAEKAGFSEIAILLDLAGHPRVLVASLPRAGNADS